MNNAKYIEAAERLVNTPVENFIMPERRSENMDILLQVYIYSPAEHKDTYKAAFKDMFGIHPEFLIVLEAIKALPDSQADSVEAFDLYWRAHTLAPEHLKAAFQEKFGEMFGPLPEPSWYDENGEAYYSIQEVSNILGIPSEELELQVKEMRVKDGEFITVH